jgi:hypothetical protein
VPATLLDVDRWLAGTSAVNAIHELESIKLLPGLSEFLHSGDLLAAWSRA